MLPSRTRPLFYGVTLVLLVILPGDMLRPMAQASEHPAPRHLWHMVQSPPPFSHPPDPKKPWIVRDREIALDHPLLYLLKDAGARPLPRIMVELFDGVTAEVDVVSTVSRINDTAVIHGRFKSPLQGSFTFAITGNLLIATMHMGHRLYKTEHIGNGRLLLVEIDPDKMPPD